MKLCYISYTQMIRFLKCSERFPELLEKVKLFLLASPTMCFVKQGFSQVLHMHNKHRNCLDVNKTGEMP